MFDFNNNGTIDFNEFCSLWQYVTDWTRTFKGYDLDGNGTINHQELSQGENFLLLFKSFVLKDLRRLEKTFTIIIKKYFHGHSYILSNNNMKT